MLKASQHTDTGTLASGRRWEMAASGKFSQSGSSRCNCENHEADALSCVRRA